MASVRKTRTGRWELQLVHKLLQPKGRRYFTFDTQAEAAHYGAQAEKWLAAGMLPPELQAPAHVDGAGLLGPIIRAWVNSGGPSAADNEVLGRLFTEVGGERLADMNFDWCETWVRKLKVERNLTPGGIRKRVQALTRAIDWHLRKSGQALVGNPLHLLPRGYSTYTERDQAELAKLNAAAGDQARPMVAKVDAVRDRRLAPEEEARVRAALAGQRAEGRERLLQPEPDFLVLWELILGTGLRLREAYRLRVDQVDLQARVLTVQVSKTWRGQVRFRKVPLQPHVFVALRQQLQRRRGRALLFPWWDGTPAALKQTTARLSARFAVLFGYAGVADFHEHDLRHEATCRWFELRAPDGAWLYREAEVVRIMGWAPNSAMAHRYASFRAEDLASRLWMMPVAGEAA